MTSLAQILLMILNFAYYIILAHFIMSWLISFQVLNTRQPIVAQFWRMLNQITEPVYKPIRRILPNLGGIDLSPIIVIFGIVALRIIIQNNMFY